MGEILSTALAVLVGIAAGLTAAGVIYKAPPVRWLVRRLILEPAGGRLRTIIREEVGEEVGRQLDRRPLTNGWGAKTVAVIGEHLGAPIEPLPTHHDDEETPDA